MLQIKDTIYHPCSLDIIPFEVKGIHTYEDQTVYEAKSTGGVGMYSSIRILLNKDRKGNIRFIGFSENQDYDIVDMGEPIGLEDFVEGFYYTDRQEARLKFYDIQHTLSWSNVKEKERLYLEAKQNFDRIDKILKEIKQKEI